MSYAHVVVVVVNDAVRDRDWKTDDRTWERNLAPEGLYGRGRMTALFTPRQVP